MDNNLQFILSLKDLMSPAMLHAAGVADSEASRIASDFNKITAGANSANNGLSRLEAGFESMKEMALGVAAGIGITTLIAGGEQVLEESVERVHALHQAEAQLANTMKNTGTYSHEAFEEVISGSEKMAKNILFNTEQVVGLQSQLRLVGNIGEEEMQRMVMASADMATKFHMGLEDAGNAIAKAINNPEMMRRLGMQLKIDPAVQQHIQDLAKHGKEAQAQLELLNIVESKVGGAAKAAFDADPLAKFHKVMEGIEIKIGGVALALQQKLAAAFNYVVEAVKDVVHWMEEHKTLMEVVGGVVGILTTAILLQYTVVGLVAGATKAWAAVQWLLNESMLANPLTWVIAGIIAIIALIAYVAYRTDGWRKQWEDVIGFFKSSWAVFKDTFYLIWLNVQDNFLKGLDVIKTGWYEIQKLWNKDAGDAGLKSIQDEANKRAAEIAKQKGVLDSDLKAAQSHVQWDLSVNNKTLDGLTSDLKKKLGFGGTTNPVDMNGEGHTGSGVTGISPTGKDKADSINNGGQRSIVINIAKQTGAENIYVSSGKEAANEIEGMVREAMRRVMLSLNGNAVSAG
jgi:hypothetical protein